ncbi:argonaute 1 [Coemansia aciculifera]|nr:argonaute 1 [Coemansia aciculifera]
MHIYVLHDDSKFTADEIQCLTYRLCYTCSICTHSMSLVPPVHYAHRVADRARCHLVGMGRSFEETSTGEGGYCRGTGTTAVGTAPGDPRFATKIISIRQELTNTTYFM